MATETRRIFLAHPKGADAELDEMVGRLQEIVWITPLANGATCEPIITTGRESFEAFEAKWTGDPKSIWSAWIDHVLGQEAGQPRFQVFVVAPSNHVGKATAEIVTRALTLRRPVAFMEGAKLRPVARVTRMDPKDFKTGWAVLCAG